jgi:polysaccharide deacetylase 2 family uncharacterized protein YibQ
MAKRTRWTMFGDYFSFRKGPKFALVLACALLSGFALAAAGEARLTSFPAFALGLPQGWKDKAPSAPAGRAGWPSWMLGRNQETRSKSQAASPPAIAIVIDDLGADAARTRQAIALPGAITLSFLGYPETAYSLSHEAHLAGHEVIVHLSMEPTGSADPGPMALLAGLAPAELTRRLAWALERVSDYDGANNHMGSRFTASREGLVPVMQELAARHLLFLDSRTTPATEAESVAREAGMLTGSRDIFLDDDERAVAVEGQLKLVEQRARMTGSAIAIGHPHPETLAALKAWTAGLSKRGFRLAAVKDVLQMREDKNGNGVASSILGLRR